MLIQQKLIVSLVLFSCVVPASADAVYVVNSNNQFGTVDLGTGAFRQIGPNTPEAEGGLVPVPNGSLLTLTASGSLDAINPRTGLTTVIGPTGLGDCSMPTSPCGPTSANTIAGLAGVIYGTDYAGNLYTVNPATGRATLIGPTGIPPVTFVPLSTPNPDGSLNFFGEGLFAANGKLYALFETGTVNFTTGAITPIISDSLYQIDAATGATTVVAPITFGVETAADVNGTVYAFDNATSEILTVNLRNGNTSFVSNLEPAAGLVFGATPTPEPFSVALSGIGIAAMIACRLRKGGKNLNRS
jgi:hypothetical protein